jgi:hypothetical protein
MLKLTLTDGVGVIGAIEYRAAAQLTVDLPPGTKVRAQALPSSPHMDAQGIA